MIPKIIHYCWFGYNQKSNMAEKCIASWKKYCPDYEIIEWNEKNFDISSAPLYVRQAYDAKKWAFATDYIRLWIIYNYGGIYLDTDVELIKPLDSLLEHSGFIGRQPGYQVNTGAGFGACAKHPGIKEMLDDYENIPFIKVDGTMDLLTCPHRNSLHLIDNGLLLDDSYQEITDMVIYPVEYFSPMDAYSRELKVSKNTYSIHHCEASWNPNETKAIKRKRYWVFKMKRDVDYLLHTPNRVLMKLLGNQRYEELKKKLKGSEL